jgi:hypothetical protein
MKTRVCFWALVMTMFASTVIFADPKDKVDFNANVSPPSIEVMIVAPGVFDPLLGAFVIDRNSNPTWKGQVQVNSAVAGGKENASPSAEDLKEVRITWEWDGDARLKPKNTKTTGNLESTTQQEIKKNDPASGSVGLRVDLSGSVMIDGVSYQIAPNQTFTAASVNFFIR